MDIVNPMDYLFKRDGLEEIKFWKFEWGVVTFVKYITLEMGGPLARSPVVFTAKQVSERKKTFMDLTEIPLDLLVQITFSYLTANEIGNLARTSRKMRDVFTKESIWNSLYTKRIVKDYYEELKNKLTFSKNKRVNSLPRTKINVIFRNSSSVKCDLWYAKKDDQVWDDLSYIIKKVNKKPCHKGYVVTTSSYPNTKFIVTPTLDELLRLKCSNLGFSFVVDRTQTQEFVHSDGKKMTAYVRHLRDPKKLLPISKLTRNDSYKKGFIRIAMGYLNRSTQVTVPSDFNTLWDKNSYRRKQIMWDPVFRTELWITFGMDCYPGKTIHVPLSQETCGQENIHDKIEILQKKEDAFNDEIKILRKKLKILEMSSRDTRIKRESYEYARSCF